MRHSTAFHLQANGAAAQALGLLQRGVVCGLCVEACPERSRRERRRVCPASAIELVEARSHQMVAQINPALCKGCGVCVAACPACPEHSRGKQSRRVEGPAGAGPSPYTASPTSNCWPSLARC